MTATARRDGAWAADITGLLDLSSWLAGMRIIVPMSVGTQARSCGSPTSMTTGSPPSPPEPGAVSSWIWSCATAGGHGARSASGPRKTLGRRTCRSRSMRRTGSDARSSRWPASCSAGRRCSHWPGPPAAGSRSGSACASSLSQGGSPAAAAACGSASPNAGRGPQHHRRGHPPLGHPTRLTSSDPDCHGCPLPPEGATGARMGANVRRLLPTTGGCPRAMPLAQMGVDAGQRSPFDSR